MRISDWSSDVCTSGLLAARRRPDRARPARPAEAGRDERPQPVRPRLMPHARRPWSLPAVVLAGALVAIVFATMLVPAAAQAQSTGDTQRPIGRESCRERVGQYV